MIKYLNRSTKAVTLTVARRQVFSLKAPTQPVKPIIKVTVPEIKVDNCNEIKEDFAPECPLQNRRFLYRELNLFCSNCEAFFLIYSVAIVAESGGKQSGNVNVPTHIRMKAGSKAMLATLPMLLKMSFSDHAQTPTVKMHRPNS